MRLGFVITNLPGLEVGNLVDFPEDVFLVGGLLGRRGRGAFLVRGVFAIAVFAFGEGFVQFFFGFLELFHAELHLLVRFGLVVLDVTDLALQAFAFGG